MQFSASTTLLAVLAGISPLVTADQISVTNSCDFPLVVVHGSPTGNDAPVTLASDGGLYSLPIGTSSGQLLQFKDSASSSSFVQWNWTPASDGNTYTGLAEVGSSPANLTAYGNAFVPVGQDLPAGNCYAVECEAGDESCYQRAGGATCPGAADWQITLCQA